MSKAIDTIQRLHDKRDAERKAWARLVRAERAAGYFDPPGSERDENAESEVSAARQALRDLGVDVDALLEAP